MSTFNDAAETNVSFFRLSPSSRQISWRQRQVFDTLVSDEVESADMPQEPDQDSDSATSDKSAELTTYNRMMQEHLRWQMESKILANSQKELSPDTLKQLGHRYNGSTRDVSTRRLVDLQAMLPSPLCVDFSQLTVGEGNAMPRNWKSELQSERSARLVDGGRALQDTAQEISRDAQCKFDVVS